MEALSVIIPAFNESGNIKPLISRLSRSLDLARIKYELIFIDDNSTDNTFQTVCKIKAEQANLPISIFKKVAEQGKARCLLEGFSYAKYPLVAFIDADLQYPPEAIVPMLKKIQTRVADIVIAERKKQKTSFLRQLSNHTFSFVFCKLLHGLDYDVQTGLKVFRKKILKDIILTPTPWAFDLEFLVKARNTGYIIDKFEIVFGQRLTGSSKVNVLKTAFELVPSALKLKFARKDIIPFSAKEVSEQGMGFHLNGKTYVPHTDLKIEESALYRFSQPQILIFFGFILFIAYLLKVNWHIGIVAIVATLTTFYFADLLFNLYLIFLSLFRGEDIKIADEQTQSPKDWPTYTILCPLYKEWSVLPQFIDGISNLDYPKDKLQVILLLEEDDIQTILHIRKMPLPEFFQIIIVPNSVPKTKPKACNYGLAVTQGKYVVIYDAEDIPEPLQLKKAILAFEKSDDKTFCIQAKLNFYNPNQNVLTKLFTAEYSLWFDLILTGLHSIKAPIPLGGTSNHFKTEQLKNIKGWDAFNVTEDCDLGIRLSKKGYHTAIIDSTTYEEANSSVTNWLWQRTRWIKGYMQTYLVHMRNPAIFLNGGRKTTLLMFQLTVGGKIFSMFINPFMWVITIVYFTFRPTVGTFIESFFPAPVLYMGTFSLIFGNFLYLYYYMIGCIKRGNYELVKYAFLIPFYWLYMSVAAWLALYKLLVQPHYWSKTKHGLHLTKYRVAGNTVEEFQKSALVRVI